MNHLLTVSVRQISIPVRRVIIKRGIRADDYFDYCSEVGCGVWEPLSNMDSLLGEPVCLWLPDAYKKPKTSTYVQAIRSVQRFMDRYAPSAAGFRWDDENPRIQLEPRGEQGYIELRAVKPLK